MNLEDAIATEVARQVSPLLVEQLATGMADPCFTPAQAAAYLGISKRVLHDLPIPRVHPSPGSVRYRLSALNAHLG